MTGGTGLRPGTPPKGFALRNPMGLPALRAGRGGLTGEKY